MYVSCILVNDDLGGRALEDGIVIKRGAMIGAMVRVTFGTIDLSGAVVDVSAIMTLCVSQISLSPLHWQVLEYISNPLRS